MAKCKFPRLVANEYIKIFTKVSTWVLIALVVLTSIGYTAVAKFTQYMDEKNRVQYMDSVNLEEDYQNQIEYQKQEKAPGYENEIERLQFLLDHKIGYNDWRYDEIAKLYLEKANLESEADGTDLERVQKQLQNKLDLIAADNWKGYYTLMQNQYMSDPELSKEEKEASAYLYNYALKNDVKPDPNDWRISLAREVSEAKMGLLQFQEVQGQQMNEEALTAKAEMEKTALTGDYRLTHNLETVPAKVDLNSISGFDFWSVLGLSNILINVISMVIIIIAGASIANEFTNGTIKFLLINPVKRWKIFLSKYTMILTLSVLLVLGFFVTNTLFSGILFGFGDILNPYLYVADGVVKQIPGLLFILWQYLIGSVNLIVMGTLAFAISSLLRNSAVAIGVSVFAMLAGNVIVMFLGGALHLDWARFLIFANTDLNAIISGTTIFQGMTPGFSLAVIGVHMVIFFLTAWDGFMRRESI